MSDDLSNRGSQDRTRISTSEQWELDYWTKKFNCTEDELKKAVQQAGNSADAVEEYLNQ